MSNISNLNTWFICDNCECKSFYENGVYMVDGNKLCYECMNDMEEQCQADDNMSKFEV